MSNLKRDLAPITPEAWKFIEEEAEEILQTKLIGRKAVDFVGPKGIDFAAVNTGRRVEVEGPTFDVDYSKRHVLPLLEVEAPFTMELEEIEALVRGAEDVDSDSLVEAANKVAAAENNAIFYGLEDPAIEGMVEAAEQPAVEIEGEDLISPVADGISQLIEEGIEGPYNLLLGSKLYSQLYKASGHGYPVKKRLEEMIEGEIIAAPLLENRGILIPDRSGDFELIGGQDISIGFKEQSGDQVEFFFTESFTFRVNAPEAIVVLE